MIEWVCPDAMDSAAINDCWKSAPGRNVLADDVDLSQIDIVSWLKDEMLDGLNHASCHEVDGPFIFGVDEEGVPNFEVFRHNNRSWATRYKKGRGPSRLTGIAHQHGVEYFDSHIIRGEN